MRLKLSRCFLCRWRQKGVQSCSNPFLPVVLPQQPGQCWPGSWAPPGRSQPPPPAPWRPRTSPSSASCVCPYVLIYDFLPSSSSLSGKHVQVKSWLTSPPQPAPSFPLHEDKFCEAVQPGSPAPRALEEAVPLFSLHTHSVQTYFSNHSVFCTLLPSELQLPAYVCVCVLAKICPP